MKASKKSIHGGLYRFTYDGEFPENLCPYFWKLVIGVILFIPNFILQFPALIVGIFRKDPYDCFGSRCMGAGIYIATLFVSAYIVSQIHWFKAMFNAYSYDNELANAGWAIDAGIVLIIFISYIMEIRKRNKRKSEEQVQEKKPSILIEFVKAKYNRYCPKIDWE